MGKAKRITVTVLTKDGFDRSDYAFDVGFNRLDEEEWGGELFIDWKDGTTSFIRLENLVSFLLTR